MSASESHLQHHEAAHSAHDHHDHGVMHEGHITLMRNRFWVSLPLTIIVVLYSEMIQEWLGFTMPAFPGSEYIAPVLGSFIFFYGGLPFLSMARQELASRQPGMMTLISLAITTAYVYSMAVCSSRRWMSWPGESMDLFWELATLITVMLLGHWIELRSVSQAQGALKELAKLLPDTAERICDNGETEKVAVTTCRPEIVCWCAPGASIPADGVIAEGESQVNESMITGESRPVEKKAGDQVIAGTVNGFWLAAH
jgi:P-type Cu2+ transporter